MGAQVREEVQLPIDYLNVHILTWIFNDLQVQGKKHEFTDGVHVGRCNLWHSDAKQ
jgi:hypothetical protein